MIDQDEKRLRALFFIGKTREGHDQQELVDETNGC